MAEPRPGAAVTLPPMDRPRQPDSNGKPPEADQGLVRRAVGGDESALEDLLAAHHDLLARHVERQLTATVRSRLAVEDVLQQTYLQVFKSIGAFEPRGPGGFAAWLKTIASRKLIDAARSRGRERVVTSAEGHRDPGQSTFADLAGLVACSAPGPTSLVMAEELRGAFHVALGELPANYRTVVQLRYLDNRSLEEVAENLGVTVGAARGLCHRARQALRDEILRLSRFI